MSNEIEISILITTKNEEKNLSNLINSIISQKFKNYEIIIVDNYSTDKTQNIIKNYPDIKLYQKGPERGHQRAYGIGKCKGKLVFWPDADHILSDFLLTEISEKGRDDNYSSCMFIPERIIENNFFNKVRNYERMFYDATPIDCPRVIPLHIFKKILDLQKKTIIFDSGADDWDIYNYCEKLSNFVITKNIIKHNETELKIINYLNKKIKYMPSMDGFKKKWKDHHLNKIRFNPYNRLIKIFIQNGGYKKILAKPHLFVSMIFLRFAVGLIYLVYK